MRSLAAVFVRRWWVVALVSLLAGVGSLISSMLSTPEYRASARLFVSSSSGASGNDLYQGGLYSQQVVASYTQLLTGETLARRTVERLGLDESADDLRSRVRATAAPGTVLITVTVSDESPFRAADIANALSDEFVEFASELVGSDSDVKAEVVPTRVVVEQHATPPATAATPKVARNLAIALILGGFVGFGLAFAVDRFDRRVRTRDDVEALELGPVLASVPNDNGLAEGGVVSFSEGSSGAGEAFRRLRTNLSFVSVDNGADVIAVTSSVAGEGKTSVTINLAASLAESGRSVVVVDADLRRPKVGERLGAVGTVGFTDFLRSGSSILDFVTPTKVDGLSVLPAGSSAPNPTELLGSQRASDGIAALRDCFDFVLIDTAPVLLVSDPTVIGGCADGVVVVARRGVSDMKNIGSSVSQLSMADIPLLGFVYNGDLSTSGAYGYGESYSSV
ncbi:polysaccharide biosynthesis tyrosine autokinase [Gordonia desulfuricans]|uniref:non-specific protein-tyrosine kinase n=1 Tax=Gordonia desulfuricans TaxID=89051 RepID=A0A7K3LTS3_9ACTN|nr:polysaccharide biosynthesis tyrosine autokinase [Gordonia desulfuricans]NDK91675.1 polysaccharide biosynthesis tyrosine autokinase [Gordonia desulfuricans]